MTKAERSLSKQCHLQPHCHSKARSLSRQREFRWPEQNEECWSHEECRPDRAEKRLRMRYLRPSQRHQRDQSAGKSRLKQQIPTVKSIAQW